MANEKAHSPEPPGKFAPTCKPALAMSRVEILLGCYPQSTAHDPKTYMMALAAVLCEYPAWVVERVSDPRTGIARRIRFLPTVAELIADCEELLQPVRAERHRRAVIAQQLAERKAIAAPTRADRPTLEELKKRYGPNWGLRTVSG